MALPIKLLHLARRLLDFTLPPRCPSCGAIVDAPHLFCAPCWGQVDFLGVGGCDRCGLPLEGTEIERCAACLAHPPPLDRVRAAVVYGEIARSLVLKLKYGRKVGVAETMARNMRRLMSDVAADAILTPVPLHRTRLWGRGFNQALLLARGLSRSSGHAVEPALLRRVRRTPRLKGLSPSQRHKTVTGAFRAHEVHDFSGRTVILVDDVYTTGSTANACARALKRAGAERVELICWSRVVRPSRLAP